VIRRFSKLAAELGRLREVAGVYCTVRYALNIIRYSLEIAQTGSLLPADKAMVGKTYTFQVFGTKVVIDGAMFGAARETYGQRAYFAVPGFSLHPTDTVVDLGANAGVFTILAALLKASVIAVEAQAGFVDCLRNNVRRNRCEDQVIVVLGVVGPRSGLFSDPIEFRAASHSRGQMPPQIRMCELLADHHVQRVNFMKVDIEGSEFDLFTSDNAWLSTVDRIAMEVHTAFGDVGGLQATLREFGFHVSLQDKDHNCVDMLTSETGYLYAFQVGFGETQTL
jgi:FkbM family methyltransferase